MASARAFVDANEKAKAIESYEKAILAAPDYAARDAATRELNSISAWCDSPWFTPFLRVIQSIWAWIGLIFSYLLLRRFLRWLLNLLPRKKRYRVIVTPSNGGEFASYFRELVRRAHHSFEEQLAIARRINAWNANAIRETFQSTSLLAALPFSLPTVLASKWWSPFVSWIVNMIDAPDYTVDLGILRTENQFGLSVRLCSRGGVIRHWHTSCADNALPDTLGNLAYQVVANIKHHQRTGDHVP